MAGAGALAIDHDAAQFASERAGATTVCFHCGETIPRGIRIVARLHDDEREVCCQGCRAVVELIAGSGLDDYYRYRDEPGAKPADDAALSWAAYDSPDFLAQCTRVEGNGERSAVLLLEGMRCAACAWLIEKTLRSRAGVIEVDVNSASKRARIVWSAADTAFSVVLDAISRLGYRPVPSSGAALRLAMQTERRSALKRLAVAGLGMMQVMMFAVALYIGKAEMDDVYREYLRLVSLLVATPVLLYSGWPFFGGAARALRARTMNMDVPVSIALLLAYSASVWNAVQRRGEVYFDSVTMFVFFLTLGRYIEMLVRHRSGDVTEALAHLLPRVAHRVTGTEIEDVPANRLTVGDTVLVRIGETIPADGCILEGVTACEEALLTGESLPVSRGVGDTLIAGALNVQAPIIMRITAVGQGTVLSGIVALLDKAQANKPHLARAADRAAAWFLRRVLLGSAIVGAAWLWIDPTRTLDIVLAVLVVTCPCALSLATPTAIAAATAALARCGVLIVRADAIEDLAGVNLMLFDKTGTLTQGRIGVESCRTFGAQTTAQCYTVAAALEQAAEHPIGRAFKLHADRACKAGEVQVFSGHGVEGRVEGRLYRIGTADFVGQLCALPIDPSRHDDEIFLAGSDGPLASFRLNDILRSDAAQSVAQLRSLGIDAAILSGDSWSAVKQVAEASGIEHYSARLTPAAKLRHLQDRLTHGDRVAVVGDGVNDAPMLRAAQVSIAMSSGAALAQAGADVVLTGDSLTALPKAVEIARRTRAVMRQNLGWAVFYNLCALPIAALGWVPPWLAAVGMTLSSTIVVANALRLLPRGRRATQQTSMPAAAASHRL